MKRNYLPQGQSHPSYDLHRRQVWTRILLPVIGAALGLSAVIIMASLATFQGSGDVSRWAAISTIWLVIPVMVAGVVLLVVLGAMIYLLGRAGGLIPPYSYQAQRIVFRVAAGARRGAEMVRRPALAAREIGELVRNRLQKARERM